MKKREEVREKRVGGQELRYYDSPSIDLLSSPTYNELKGRKK